MLGMTHHTARMRCQPVAATYSVFSGWTRRRSILWTNSASQSSLAIDWVGLPQPRSKIALAAETRAAAVASLLRITPTRTLSAVLVWLRASERISVSVLRIRLAASFRSSPSSGTQLQRFAGFRRSRTSLPHRDRDQADQRQRYQ